MASTSTDRALGIPEILGRIFDILGPDYHTLSTAARVSTLWFECATDSLWREPPCTALAEIPRCRQQVYANKIQCIMFKWQEEKFHKVFKDLHFKKLRVAGVDFSAGKEPQHLNQYLQPSLETFSYRGGQMEPETLSLMQATCWRLRTICIETPGKKISPAMLFKFISGFKSLQSINFSKGCSDLVSDELLVHLAGRPNLTSLRINRSLEPELLSRIEQLTSGNIFSSLRTLCLSERVPSASIVLLASKLTRLTSIDASLLENDNDVFEAIASMNALQSISIVFYDNVTVSSDQLLFLRSHSNLEWLHIVTNGCTLRSIGFHEPEFRQLFAALPKLKLVCSEVLCDISISSLAFLSEKCQELQFLELPFNSFDFDAFFAWAESQAVIFPCLKVLHLGPGIAPGGLGALFRKHIPTLKVLILGEDHIELPTVAVH